MKKVQSHQTLINASRSVVKGADAQRAAIAACRELGLFDSKLHLSQSPVGQSMARDFNFDAIRSIPKQIPSVA